MKKRSHIILPTLNILVGLYSAFQAAALMSLWVSYSTRGYPPKTVHTVDIRPVDILLAVVFLVGAVSNILLGIKIIKGKNKFVKLAKVFLIIYLLPILLLAIQFILIVISVFPICERFNNCVQIL